MEKTTIQLDNETKEKISSFGKKGESYDDILRRLYSFAVKEQLKEFLMSSKGFVPIEEAMKEADKKDQQKVINEIKDILRNIGAGSFANYP